MSAPTDAKTPPSRDALQALLRDAALQYRRNLHANAAAQAYLRNRGIDEPIAERYGLGFARPAWRDLGEVLAPHSDETVLASGLLVCHGAAQAAVAVGGLRAAAGDAHRFDRFRNRLMFPIRDLDGAVVGFGGRYLGEGDAHAKYLNSPQSEVFHKRELLYGLYEAKEAIQDGADAVIVEGYVDVLAAQQAGVAGAVGSLGTACTAAQLEALLAVGAKRVVFCFDGDAAGRQAAERALATVLPLASDGRSFAFAVLAEGHDPDSLVREQGAAALQRALGAAQPLRLAALEQLVRGCDLRWAEGRTRFAARAAQAWRSMPAGAERDWLEARVRDVLQSGEPWVREYLEARSACESGAAGAVLDRAGSAAARPMRQQQVWGRAHAPAA